MTEKPTEHHYTGHEYDSTGQRFPGLLHLRLAPYHYVTEVESKFKKKKAKQTNEKLKEQYRYMKYFIEPIFTA